MTQNDYLHLNRKITKELFFELRDDSDAHRKVFGRHSGVQKRKARPTFSVSFEETIRPIYESMTPNRLSDDKSYEQYYHFLETDHAVKQVENWEREMGEYVFLRDGLFCSVALSSNLKEDGSTQTQISKAFHYAKYKVQGEKHTKAIEMLADRMIEAIDKLPFYKDSELISAVPPRPDKESFDLPSALAESIALKRGITDITGHFKYSNARSPAKALERDQKWANCEQSGLSFNGTLNQPVILIDDLYQSGVTVNYTGMILQKAGATSVYGLYAVKSQRDTDNT